MTESPLLKRTRARMAKQRELEKDRWLIQPAALQKKMILWVFRIVAIMVLLGLMLYRFSGGVFF